MRRERSSSFSVWFCMPLFEHVCNRRGGIYMEQTLSDCMEGEFSRSRVLRFCFSPRRILLLDRLGGGGISFERCREADTAASLPVYRGPWHCSVSGKSAFFHTHFCAPLCCAPDPPSGSQRQRLSSHLSVYFFATHFCPLPCLPIKKPHLAWLLRHSGILEEK